MYRGGQIMGQARLWQIMVQHAVISMPWSGA